MTNRIIKFRVWNGIEWCGKITIGQIVEPFDYGSFDDLVFQQFTGLLDKNGKEIYEGDIIKGDMDFGPAGFHERTLPVSWVDSLNCYQFHYWDIQTIKIVGNIFETPELLKWTNI